MELAMHCRDSGGRVVVQALYRSEWTVGVWHCSSTVAFPGGVRQRLLESGEKPRRKVAVLRSGVIACGVQAWVRQRSRGTCSFGLVSLFSAGYRLWRTACSAFELWPVVEGKSSHIVPRLLAVIWFHTTRLETRTKESNMCASLWVIETRRHNESKGSSELK